MKAGARIGSAGKRIAGRRLKECFLGSKINPDEVAHQPDGGATEAAAQHV